MLFAMFLRPLQGGRELPLHISEIGRTGNRAHIVVSNQKVGGASQHKLILVVGARTTVNSEFFGPDQGPTGSHWG